MSNYARTRMRRKSPVESDDEKSRLAPQSSTSDAASHASLATVAHNDPGHNFGQIAVQPTPETAPAVAPQTKLRVSQPGDTREQEADQVADAVMRMPATEEKASGETAAARAMASQSGGSQEAIPATDGQPLDAATRAYMEPRFGHDFGQVRVHTDEQAAQAAADYHARAYTIGSDIVFGAREYAPGTGEGQRLLAHELTHVVQQGSDATAAATVQREPTEAALPDTTVALGKKVSPDRMKDQEIAEGILHKLRGILDAWKTALNNFYVVLVSSSDKETRPNFPNVILEFLREEAIGEIIKYVPLEMGRAYKLLTSLGTEDKKAQAAQDSAKLRDFVVSHASAIGNLLTAVENNWSDFVASVRLTGEAMNEGETSSSSSKAGKGKGKWDVDTSQGATKVFDDYWMMRMSLQDTYTALDAQAGFATAENLFRVLSEEWIRGTMIKEGWGTKHASIVIHMNKDFSVKEAHIQGSGGQKIADQLMKDAQKAGVDSVDIYNMDVRKEIQYFGTDSGYPSAYVYLDENNSIHDAVRGDETVTAIWEYIRANKANALRAKKMDGD
ncbi:MAG TPA: DUF4157 domain-containing protein [Ktedonobacterales bacterium]|nr:DUF4157 domain-containing protein [Ktedonobacterales bacterium]